jgi:hypothetical protein
MIGVLNDILFDEMDKEVVMFFQCAFIVFNFKYIFNDNEDEGNGQFIDLTNGGLGCLGHNVGHTKII